MQQKHFILAAAKPKISFLLTHLAKTALNYYSVIHLANPQKRTWNDLSHEMLVSGLIGENKIEDGLKCTVSSKDGRHFFKVNLIELIFENFARDN